MFMREVQLLQNQLIINTQKKLLSTHVGVVSFNPQIRQAIYVKNVKEKLTKGTKFNSVKVSKDQKSFQSSSNC